MNRLCAPLSLCLRRARPASVLDALVHVVLAVALDDEETHVVHVEVVLSTRVPPRAARRYVLRLHDFFYFL